MQLLVTQDYCYSASPSNNVRHYMFRNRFIVYSALAISIPLGASAQSNTHNPSKYIGPGSCSASACHGGVAPAAKSRILQNEFSTWVVRDKHAQAYEALQNPVAKRMGYILGLKNPASEPKCLACHALAPSKTERGREFEINEGVSCESCHGPSSAWLGPHSTQGWNRKKSLELGMYDTEDLISRTEKCTSCHVGSQEKSVDHEMIAAGHPDLVFELDTFSAVMPAHWKLPADPFVGVKTWSVGQAVQLQKTLERVQWRANSGSWPEYSELECFSCHHSLTRSESSWRQKAGYKDREPGVPPLNPSHFVVFRSLVQEIYPEQSKQLETQLMTLYRETSKREPDKAAISRVAGAAASTTIALSQQLNAMKLDRSTTLRLARSITSDPAGIAEQGPRTAEQAAMALQSLAAANESAGENMADTDAAIRALFKLLESPSNYSAPQFAEQMRKVGATLR
jgi:hypothetical protein